MPRQGLPLLVCARSTSLSGGVTRYCLPYADADGAQLCTRISADLLEACHDKHLRLIWHLTPVSASDEARLHAALRERIRRENHGVRRVELLAGNIRVIGLTIIPELASGGPILAAAMHLVTSADALIFDLRPTRGGSPDGVVFLASYLFPDGRCTSEISSRALTDRAANSGPPPACPVRAISTGRSSS